MQLIEEIASTYCNCVATRCKDSGCMIKLDQINSSHVIISGTKYQNYYSYTQKLCDFLLFDCDTDSEYRLAVIEMKSGNLVTTDIKDIHEQLQNGANIAEVMSNQHDVEYFVPVMVKKKSIDPMITKTLLMTDKYRVKFKQHDEKIRIQRHNTSMVFP